MSLLFDYGDDTNCNKTGFISEISSIYINILNIVNLKVKTVILKFEFKYGGDVNYYKTHFISEILSILLKYEKIHNIITIGKM